MRFACALLLLILFAAQVHAFDWVTGMAYDELPTIGRERIEGKVQVSDTRIYYYPRAGETVNHTLLNNLTIRRVAATMTDDIEAVYFNIRQFLERPPAVPELPGTYKYIYIEHQGLTLANNFEIEYRVPQAWIAANGTPALYRYESGRWVEYPGVFTRELQGRDHYVAAVPGFSYYAVAPATGAASVYAGGTAEQDSGNLPANEPSDVAEDAGDAPGGASGDDTAESASPEDEAPEEDLAGPAPDETVSDATPDSGAGVYDGDEGAIGAATPGDTVIQPGEPTPPEVESPAPVATLAAESANLWGYLLVPVLGIALLAGGIFAFKKLKKPAQAVQEPDPAAQLRTFVKTMREKGMSDETIKKKLLDVGWDPIVVDMEMHVKK
jgi:PGF-pre-PGF domain-containing protein